MSSDTTSFVQPALPGVLWQHNQGKRAFMRAPVNEPALKLLEVWKQAYPVDRGGGVLLTGAAGAGKTYLAEYVTAPLACAFLDGRDQAQLNQALPDEQTLVLDQADHVLDPGLLLRFIDTCLAQNRLFMLVGRAKFGTWAGGLTDLQTRLSAMPVAHLEKPDVPLLERVLLQSLAERQIKIERTVATIAVSRSKRSFHALASFVKHLDEEALRQQKPIDRTLVHDVLKSLPEYALG